LNVAAFLDELLSRDIRLSADGGRLRCSAPAGALTPELREQLRERKAEILEFLRTAEAIARQPEGIVPMQPRGTRVPVYAVSGHNGDVFAFRDLVRHLGEDQPFFGLQAPGLEGHSEPLARVEDLAAYFASQIRAFHKSGPFIIAGYCAGGAIAFELAQQLLRTHAQVGFLALFGCAHPSVFRFSLAYWGKQRLPYWGKRIVMHTQVLATLPSFGDRRQYVAERLRRRLKALRDERTPRGTDAESLMKFRFEQATMAAVRRYTPGPYPGRVCHFIPKSAWLPANGAVVRWRSAAPHTEEYYAETVNAQAMLVDPDAAVFAELFKSCRDASALQAAS
jgi:thioesterase domain-containing protein